MPHAAVSFTDIPPLEEREWWPETAIEAVHIVKAIDYSASILAPILDDEGRPARPGPSVASVALRHRTEDAADLLHQPQVGRVAENRPQELISFAQSASDGDPLRDHLQSIARRLIAGEGPSEMSRWLRVSQRLAVEWIKQARWAAHVWCKTPAADPKRVTRKAAKGRAR